MRIYLDYRVNIEPLNLVSIRLKAHSINNIMTCYNVDDRRKIIIKTVTFNIFIFLTL
jgi:hypothetical protein